MRFLFLKNKSVYSFFLCLLLVALGTPPRSVIQAFGDEVLQDDQLGGGQRRQVAEVVSSSSAVLTLTSTALDEQDQCKDDDTYNFIIQNNKSQPCEFISQDDLDTFRLKTRNLFYCSAESTRVNGTEVRGKCPYSCGLCEHPEPISHFCAEDYVPFPPNPFPVILENGQNKTGILKSRLTYASSSKRSEVCHVVFEETEKGYTILPRIPDATRLFYAEVDEETGYFLDTGLEVGIHDPETEPIRKGKKVGQSVRKAVTNHFVRIKKEQQKASSGFSNDVRGTSSEGNKKQQRKIATTGTLKNLVVLFKFKDQENRNVPPKEKYEELFNLATENKPSVKSFYFENSLGALTIESTVADWVTIDKNEADCGQNSEDQQNNDIGIRSCIRDALEKLEGSGQNIKFSDFDVDKDGSIDGISFIHSGYGEEAGFVKSPRRVWSHKSSLGDGGWTSNDNVNINSYHISAGRRENENGNSSIIGVGLIARAIAHYLGLPDLYDYTYPKGAGIGSFGIIANAWGWEQQSKLPPQMSAWTKLQLGWIKPKITITRVYPVPLRFSLKQACTSGDVIKITANFPDNEYLLIENRQPCEFDKGLPQGGLAIWHIDDTKSYADNGIYEQGYPGQPGWPENGNHYRVALLQADGEYHLERNRKEGGNDGDSGDLFHRSGVSSIGPDGTSNNIQFPNTDAYSNGIIIKTGILISDISAAGEEMAFTLSFAPTPPSPTPPSPTAKGKGGKGKGTCVKKDSKGKGSKKSTKSSKKKSSKKSSKSSKESTRTSKTTATAKGITEERLSTSGSGNASFTVAAACSSFVVVVLAGVAFYFVRKRTKSNHAQSLNDVCLKEEGHNENIMFPVTFYDDVESKNAFVPRNGNARK